MPGTNKVAIVDVNPYGTHGITPCFVGVCIFYFLSLFLYCCFVSSPSLYSEIVSYLGTCRLFYSYLQTSIFFHTFVQCHPNCHHIREQVTTFIPVPDTLQK